MVFERLEGPAGTSDPNQTKSIITGITTTMSKAGINLGLNSKKKKIDQSNTTMNGVSPSPPFHFSATKFNHQTTPHSSAIGSVVNHHGLLSFSDLKVRTGLRFGSDRQSHVISVRCNSTAGPGSGDNESKNVLDAFFLGKAVAEAVNERLESAVGEFLSTIGRLQAEQQRQVQDFQEDVLERAKKAKENAAREAMEAQGLVPEPRTVDIAYGVNSTTSSPTTNATNPTISPSSPNSSTEDSAFGVSIDE
ncbi:uncharacterized protein At4g13200, chloroplastic [Mercurialis annua]|uniref:uncharacterized protein At4g13200, chloroplastic n=1 Tax=Mercurialis annua TaxID=3986 RepID=UPI002160715B|nr:uncharacterized protein At4g13200, chloroplastic [Mercurialis annua]